MGASTIRLRTSCALLLWLTVAVWLRRDLESMMLRHMLIQIPALVVVGALLAPRAGNLEGRSIAPAAFLVAAFSGSLWMLPRMLDASLDDRQVELFKLSTIPLLVGVPLGWSWPRLSALGKAFIWANFVSMLLVMGWLFKAAPVRLCNYYFLEEQGRLGTACLLVALAITLAWLPRVFLGGGQPSCSRQARSASDPRAGASSALVGSGDGGGSPGCPARDGLEGGRGAHEESRIVVLSGR